MSKLEFNLFSFTLDLIVLQKRITFVAQNKFMTHHISTRLDSVVFNALSQIAKESGFTKSKIIKQALEEWIEDYIDVTESIKILENSTGTISLEEYKKTRNLQ